MESASIYKVLGLMSGTSLDGLDIAYCIFEKTDNAWHYSIEKAKTLKYSPYWRKNLSLAHTFNAQALLSLDAEYGNFLGEVCSAFTRNNKLEVDFVASHGHTIFHQPQNGFTFQLGNGNALHSACGLPVIYDFRSLDVASGGQGAPLVPAGDKILFNDYGVCLNLGGIANLSLDLKGKRRAFDICFTNMGFNYLASMKGKSFDKNGALAASGEVNQKMLGDLNKIYKRFHVKRPSLGREIFEKNIKPILDRKNISVEDRLRTCIESSSIEIASAITLSKYKTNVLCTGGGTFNSFLMAALLEKCGDSAELIIPDDEVVKFKEALIFAFLGVLRVRNEINCLRSVTGSKSDSSGGVTIGF